MEDKLLKITAIFSLIFGLMTLKEGGFALFDINGARASDGNIVPFVLQFNFFSGFIYILIAFGLYKKKEWVKRLSLVMVVGIMTVFLFFIMHINNGGLYETKTLYAICFRSFTWIFIALISNRKLKNNSSI